MSGLRPWLVRRTHRSSLQPRSFHMVKKRTKYLILCRKPTCDGTRFWRTADAKPIESRPGTCARYRLADLVSATDLFVAARQQIVRKSRPRRFFVTSPDDRGLCCSACRPLQGSRPERQVTSTGTARWSVEAVVWRVVSLATHTSDRQGRGQFLLSAERLSKCVSPAGLLLQQQLPSCSQP